MDLAGSKKVEKTGAEGRGLEEAKTVSRVPLSSWKCN